MRDEAYFEKDLKQFIEELSHHQHDIWSHWMEYMFSCCEQDQQGNMIIPAEKVERWKRQMQTKYCDLTEKEKNSDRNQVQKFIHLVKPKRREVKIAVIGEHMPTIVMPIENKNNSQIIDLLSKHIPVTVNDIKPPPMFTQKIVDKWEKEINELPTATPMTESFDENWIEQIKKSNSMSKDSKQETSLIHKKLLSELSDFLEDENKFLSVERSINIQKNKKNSFMHGSTYKQNSKPIKNNYKKRRKRK